MPPLLPRFALAILLGTTAPILADGDHDAPGRSSHGDSFDEGPRRFALLMGGTGNVHFPVTTKSVEAQKFFDQGIGQLHGFWYYEAERSFRQVLHLDPNCLMAYWGMAMANVENQTRAREIIAKAIKKIDTVSETEKLWIRSLEKFFAESKNDDERKAKAKQLARDWEAIALANPDDIEAKAFVVYQGWWNSSRRGLELASPLSTSALAAQVLAKNPLHPIHHYLIHIWDPAGAKHAIPSAALCGESARSIAHMWHMPGHIYAKLERWNDSAWSQEAAARVDHLRMMERGTMPDQIHNYAHNSEWMIRNWNHVGRVKEAISVAKNMIEEPRIPRSKKVAENPDQKWDASGSAYALGRQRLLESLLRWELWDQCLKLIQTPYLAEGTEFEDKIRRAHLLALAYLAQGDAATAKRTRLDLETHVSKYKTARTTALESAEQESRAKDQNPDAINKAIAAAIAPFTSKLTLAENLLLEISILEALAEGDKTRAADLRPKLKNVPKDRLARIDLKLGKPDDAIKLAREFANENKSQVHPMAVLTEILHHAGKTDEAKAEFEKLRSLAAYSDLDLPIYGRLKPLVEANSTGDKPWVLPAPAPTDVGVRPSLPTLGPLYWAPSAGPAWNVVSSEGQPVGSQQYAGKPHILIFFLGKGCAHCIEQLRAFEPMATKFSNADLPILTISTDTLAGVTQTLKMTKEGGAFPFPIFSDAHHNAFRAFNAFDDFESKPLHGTFLIDAQGRIRWQHISYEPFMLPEFLLEEAQRLLKFTTPPAVTSN